VPVSRTLRRLLHIRDLEEEQRRLALEAALDNLERLERGLAGAAEQARRGRRLIESSAYSGELRDRLAGLAESDAAIRNTTALTPRIAAGGAEVAAVRQRFLDKRVERRQAETLIREAAAQDEVEAGRRGQQMLDDWYSARRNREERAADKEARGKSV
jgi:hypothetical protein